MPVRLQRRVFMFPLACMALAAGCASKKAATLLPPETFTWVQQPVTFSPPPSNWERQGTNDGGLTGVRFILRKGGGQVMSVEAHRVLAERDRRATLKRLIGRRDSLSRYAFLRELSLARALTTDPISDREATAARLINEALERAGTDCLADQMGFVTYDLEAALKAAKGYQATLAELLPHIRLRPEQSSHPEWWRIGYERGTVIAGLPAFASDDTLIVPEQTLLYHEIFWVVRGCAFKATFQGRQENLETFRRVVDTIQFPEP